MKSSMIIYINFTYGGIGIFIGQNSGITIAADMELVYYKKSYLHEK